MVGFLAFAGTSLQTNLMAILPTQVNVPELPYVQEISDKFAELKNNPSMGDMLDNAEIPDLSSMQTMELDFSGESDYEMPADIIEKLQSSDVTTIVGITKEMSVSMFEAMTPPIIKKIQGGLASGIEGISTGLAQLDKSLAAMQAGGMGMAQGMPPAAAAQGGMPPAPVTQMTAALDGMNAAKKDMETLVSEMQALSDAVPDAFETAKTDYLAQIDAKSGEIETVYQSTVNEGYRSIYLTVIVAAILAILVLLFYKSKRPCDATAEKS